MLHEAGPAFTVALALVLGMVAQALARHLRIPGIVLLLAAGVLFGPDFGGWVQPDKLGSGLQVLVGFAVAIILFEGGLSLNLRQLRREARAIRQIVTLGALVTAAGAAAAAMLILGWSFTVSILFGTLVIVTGPTVITPILRRIRVDHRVETVLEAEGVFGDAIGALIAVVTLEVVLQFSVDDRPATLLAGALDLLARFGVGGAVGLIGGLSLALLLKKKRIIPEGLENVFALAVVLAVFQTSDLFRHESGIVAVIVVGLVVANYGSHALDGLREFKEQLTILFIGMLFVLLAADVRLDEVRALGWPGLATVGALMFIVRPLNVAVGTWGSGFRLREKAFLAWMAPRGIVAAAVASLFAISLDSAGIEGGKELRALVFLVIAVTVTVGGLTAGPVSRLLGVRPPPPKGLLVVGATSLGIALAGAGRDAGCNVLLVDSNPESCKDAESKGFRVRYGSALDDNVLRRARIKEARQAVAVIANESVNLAFVKVAQEVASVPEIRVALRLGHRSVTPELVERSGAKVLFGEPRNIEFWQLKLGRGGAGLETWAYVGEHKAEAPGLFSDAASTEEKRDLLPLAVLRGEDQLVFLDPSVRLRTGDRLRVAVLEEKREEAHRRLSSLGFEPAEIEAEEPEANQQPQGEATQDEAS